MSGRSSIDSLRRLSRVSDPDAGAVFTAAGREALLDGVLGLPSGRGAERRPATSRRRLVLAVAVVAVAAIATAATWAITRSGPARETISVECVIGGVDTVIPASSGDPAQDCAVEWRRELGKAAPPLIAYDNTFGGVTVLPRSRKPPAGYERLKSQDAALIELQDSLDDYVRGLNSSCLDASAATTLTKAKLAEFGFPGWTVSVSSVGAPTAPSTSANAAPVIKTTPGVRTCSGGAYVDPAARTVTLGWIGVPSGSPDQSQQLAARLRPLTRRCQSLPAAVASVRAAASSLGLSESARTYELNAVKDNSLRCTSIYETVGGTIFLTLRGPSR